MGFVRFWTPLRLVRLQPKPSAPIPPDSAGVQALKTDCYFEGHSHEFISDADVELLVKGEHVLPCHSVILRLHSKVFDGLLRKDSLTTSTSTKQGYSSCSSMLKPSYASSLSLPPPSSRSIFQSRPWSHVRMFANLACIYNEPL